MYVADNVPEVHTYGTSLQQGQCVVQTTIPLLELGFELCSSISKQRGH